MNKLPVKKIQSEKFINEKNDIKISFVDKKERPVKKNYSKTTKIGETNKIKDINPVITPVEIGIVDSTTLKKEDLISAPAIDNENSVIQSVIDVNKNIDNEDRNKVEALLFAHGKYIDESIIAELCGIDKRRVKKILAELKEYYEKGDSALAIFQEENNWKINVREKYLSIVRKIVADTELPKSTMETLAVIAWKSPIYQFEVVKMRGNKCYEHIDELENFGFIIKEKKGRSYILKTTEKFLTYFEIDHGNLKNIFEAIKIPVREEQKTLEEEENIPETVSVEKKIEQIHVKRWTETDEERDSHNKFLEEMDEKIRDIENKNALLDEEFPIIKKEEVIIEKIAQETQTISETRTEESSTAKIPENITEEKKPKSLTKKQLEKKFKDELLRVREKTDKTK